MEQSTHNHFTQSSPKSITGLTTGFTDLDYMLSGLQPGHLVLIGSRPGMGKTSLSLSIAQHNAFSENSTVTIFNLELSKEQLAYRLNFMETGVKDQSKSLPNLGWKELSKEVLYNPKLHLFIDDTAGISVQEIYSKCKKYKSEHNLGLVIIDYLQLLVCTNHKNDWCEETLNTTRFLKQLAKELNISIIVLSQLYWDGSLRFDDKYIDDIILIHRRYEENAEDAEFTIAKHNNGLTGTIKLKWSQQYIKFMNSDYITGYECAKKIYKEHKSLMDRLKDK